MRQRHADRQRLSLSVVACRRADSLSGWTALYHSALRLNIVIMRRRRQMTVFAVGAMWVMERVAQFWRFAIIFWELIRRKESEVLAKAERRKVDDGGVRDG